MEDLRVTHDWVVPSSALRVHFARSGGPGGQNVNKVNTKAELRVRVSALGFPSPDVEQRFRERQASRITEEGELLITSQVHRSQSQNVEECLTRLYEMLRAALIRPRTRRHTRPTLASKERKIEEKRHRARIRKERRVDEE